MGIHSFFAGMALGLSNTTEESWNMIIAIAAHKWTEALALGISFVKSEIKMIHSIFYMAFYSLITPLGVLIGYFI